MSQRTPRGGIEAVSAAILAMNRQLEVREVLQTIVASARELLGAEYAALGVPDDHGGFAQFVVDGVSDEQWKAIGPLPRQHGVLAAMLQRGQPAAAGRRPRVESFAGWPRAHPVMKDFIGMPIRGRRRDPRRGLPRQQGCPAPAGGSGFTDEDEDLLRILADHAAIALTNARLHERSRELTLAGERARIAHELHDAVSQKLFSLRLTAQAATALVDLDPARAKEELRQVAALAAEAADELRAVVVELRPAALDEDGLVATLRTQVRGAGPGALRARHLPRRPVRALPAAQEEALLRVAQEAMHNALRHARRRARSASASTAAARARGCGSATTAAASTPPRSAGPGATWAWSPCGTGRRRRRPADRDIGARQGHRHRDGGARWLTTAIRVLLVDDHQVVRRGLRTFLEVQGDIEVVGEAGDGAEGVARAEELRPDVILMDVKMPGTDGIEALRQLRERGQSGAGADRHQLHRAAHRGPRAARRRGGLRLQGRRPGGAGRRDPLGARRACAAPAGGGRRRCSRRSRPPPATGRGDALTEREREVLALIADGRSNREIARALVLVGEDREDACVQHPDEARRRRPHPGRAAGRSGTGQWSRGGRASRGEPVTGWNVPGAARFILSGGCRPNGASRRALIRSSWRAAANGRGASRKEEVPK